MGFSVFSEKIENVNLENLKPLLLTTISPNSYGISTRDPLFREALMKSDYLVLDGVYFALSSILLQGKNICKNQGSDVFFHFMRRINEQGGKVFFLGSSEETLKKIAARASADYPNIKVAGYSPPFKQEFSSEDNQKMIEALNIFVPDVLFVGMTCPKQEKWAYQQKELVNAKLICCIGAVFDWYAGNEKTIAPMWWKFRLGWLIRTIHRPEILKRYPNIGVFFWHLFLGLLGIKKYKYGEF
jgi:N-acetylglucosaminyldiphosphoundecaprenol N-acetyl-beta-D-mannosaminyltransferase